MRKKNRNWKKWGDVMRLIDADVMREDWLENGENEHVYDTNAFLASIDEQPTIEAVTVVHAEWIDDTGCLDSVRQYKCSKCGKKPIINSNWVSVLTDFCPHCGADMRKKVQNE